MSPSNPGRDMALYPSGLDALLQEAGLVDHEHTLPFTEVLHGVGAQFISDPVGVPGSGVEQALHAVRGRIPSRLSQGPRTILKRRSAGRFLRPTGTARVKSATSTAICSAPTAPGVHLVRVVDGPLVYLGMAVERSGRGLRGRLGVYRSGKAAISDLGEAALSRALADPAFVQARLDDLASGLVRTARDWAAAALTHTALALCWATTPGRTAVAALERTVLLALADQDLRNVAKPGTTRGTPDAGDT